MYVCLCCERKSEWDSQSERERKRLTDIYLCVRVCLWCDIWRVCRQRISQSHRAAGGECVCGLSSRWDTHWEEPMGPAAQDVFYHCATRHSGRCCPWTGCWSSRRVRLNQYWNSSVDFSQVWSNCFSCREKESMDINDMDTEQKQKERMALFGMCLMLCLLNNNSIFPSIILFVDGM